MNEVIEIQLDNILKFTHDPTSLNKDEFEDMKLFIKAHSENELEFAKLKMMLGGWVMSEFLHVAKISGCLPSEY